jgi:multiple sugar transport system permease protein
MSPQKTWLKTGIGLLLTGLMLFPVYWMVNVSFTRDRDIRKSPPNWLPVPGTLEGYRAVLHQQGPYIARVWSSDSARLC